MLVLTNRRTVLFSFVSCAAPFSEAVLAHAAQGFDEEVGGSRGAKPLSELLFRRYGRDGVAFVFDEGFTGVDEDFGRTFARVGIAEKGCLTLELSVHTPGGHSSAPPSHTGIGIMSRLLVELENNPFLPAIDERNPLLTYLECAAEHGDMDDDMKARVRQRQCWPLLADKLNQDKAYMPFLRTTQAVDMVRGGIKFNALPESVHAVINYRIGFFESSQSVIDRVQSVLEPIVDSFNLSLSVLGSEPLSNTNAVRLKTYGILIEPAPISPTEGAVFGLMAGTIKHVFPGAIVVPSAMTAFTDTQYYWSLSRNIYRFVPASLTHIKNYHTVDERLHLDAHLSITRFYYKLLQNAQGLQD
ncbi:hypothetical protein JCM24511_01968 [Saitozyma sp. JCM 24511]|nr:hypothetical protein JCM24511_01968 [Saitozyma sp. JCM 24511]